MMFQVEKENLVGMRENINFQTLQGEMLADHEMCVDPDASRNRIQEKREYRRDERLTTPFIQMIILFNSTHHE